MTKINPAVVFAVLVAACVLVVTGSASAQRRHLYVPRHGRACKKGFRKGHVKIRGHRVRVCIRKTKANMPPPPGPAPRLKLHAHLDPTFTQDPLDPFMVTYEFSASASQEVASQTLGTATAATEQPAALPAGVLALYSDGKLECAVNVGGAIDSSRCPVTYSALGDHTITTIYTSGENSATATEVEHISPLATTTTLQVSYEAFAAPATLSGTNWRWVGDLVVQLGADPGGAHASLGCSDSSPDPHCFQLEGPPTEQHVYMWPGGCSEPPGGGPGRPNGPVTIRSSAPTSDGSIPPSRQIPQPEIVAGAYHVRGAVLSGGSGMPNDGYLPSEATAPLQFVPDLPGECEAP